ncbi:BTB/POZ domain-containing protein 6-like isoform X3 [Dreissena polymorpha]|uniref:BTB/POZ domain-containing protein 6-like isoform X3 n=1 Tax=Dreissena polymorpha TaxID=45954 RepID=UPI002264F5C1|nr:BTB/POZ domain-containing protein 6-like isoform X3 [Dreissena polymorpha]
MEMTTKWQYSESFAETNLKMLENEALCDVIFAAGNEQKQIKCHKVILASRSPVFYAMFCGTLAESKDVIYVPDIESSTLDHLLRYLYSGKVEINAGTVLSLLYTAKKYDIPGLASQCKTFLNDNLDAENVCTVLDQTIVFDDEEMKAKSLEFIMDKSESVLKSDAFTRMSKSGLQEVLKLETFSASECELYLGCKRWAAQRCRVAGKQETDEHIRQELGDELIDLIRFPTMTLEEFTDVVTCEYVLNKDEMLSVYRSIVKKENVSKFKNKHRLSVIKKCLFERFKTVGGSWANGGAQDGLSFIVSKDCYLSGIDMFLPDVEGSVTGVLELLEGTTVIHTQNVTLRYNKGVEHVLVDLEKCLHLNSRSEYSIRQIMKGSRAFYCASAKTNITMQGVDMTLSDLKVGKSDNGTTSNIGQFYGFALLIHTKK